MSATTYPVHVDAELDRDLSRWLWLVKWLLVLPHYVVLTLLWLASALLGVVAFPGILVTGRYPPFTLDQGEHEPGEARVASPSGPPAPAPQRPAWTAGRVVSLTLGAVLVVLSLGLGLPASALVAADLAGRDDDGFLMSGTQPLATGTHALVSGNLELHSDLPSDIAPESLVGDTRLTVEAPDGRATFLGIAPTTEVQDYLDGVEVAVLTDVRDGRAVLEEQGAGSPAEAPGALDIWVAQSSGSGPQSVTWTPTRGDWTVVVMNADGTSRVAVDAAAGAEVPALHWVIAGLLTLAGLALLAGVVLVALPLRSVARDHDHVDCADQRGSSRL